MVLSSWFLVPGSWFLKRLALLLLGGAGGNLRGGRVLDYSDQPNRCMGSLFLSLMDWDGVKLNRFGGFSERLPAV